MNSLKSRILTVSLLWIAWSSCSSAQPCLVGPNGVYGYTDSPNYSNAQVCKANGTVSVIFYCSDPFNPCGMFYPGGDVHEFFDARIAMVQANGVLYAPVRSEGFWTLPCYRQYLDCRNTMQPPWPPITCEVAKNWQVFDPVTLNWIGQADTGGGPILAKPLFTPFICPTPAASSPTPAPSPTRTRTPAGAPTATSTPGCFPPFCVSPSVTPTSLPGISPTATPPAQSPSPTPTSNCVCPTVTPVATPTCPPGCVPAGSVDSRQPVRDLVRKKIPGGCGAGGGSTPALLVAGLLLAWRRLGA